MRRRGNAAASWKLERISWKLDKLEAGSCGKLEFSASWNAPEAEKLGIDS